MPYLSRENLYRPATTPEQMNFIENFYNMFDSGGAHKKILNVEPLYYLGTIAGSEFLTYAATKLYLALNIGLEGAIIALNQTALSLNDENNNLSFNIRNLTEAYATSTEGIFYVANNFDISNLYFSRILNVVNYVNIKFNGYRITLN
jgi:hypothetical protein